jgi:hypothetical protein
MIDVKCPLTSLSIDTPTDDAPCKPILFGVFVIWKCELLLRIMLDFFSYSITSIIAHDVTKRRSYNALHVSTKQFKAAWQNELYQNV